MKDNTGSVPENVFVILAACTHCFSTRSVGLPRFQISKDHLEYFVKYELTCPDITAEVLCVGPPVPFKGDSENFTIGYVHCHEVKK